MYVIAAQRAHKVQKMAQAIAGLTLSTGRIARPSAAPPPRLHWPHSKNWSNHDPVYDGYPVSAVEALIDHQIAGTLGGDAVAYCACGWKSIDEAPRAAGCARTTPSTYPQQPDTGWSVTRTGTPMGDLNYERRKRAFVEQPFAEATQTHHKLTEDANGNPTGVAAVLPAAATFVHHPATGRPDLRPAGED